MFTPKLIDGLIGRQVEKNRFVINEPQSNTYLELNTNEFFIYERIDGERDVEEIAALFLERFCFLGHTLIHDTIEKLSKYGFLEQKLILKSDELDKYLDVQKRLLSNFVFTFSKPFLSKSFERLSNFLGRFLFLPPILLFTSIFNISAIIFFIYYIPHSSLFTYSNSYVWGFWINLIIILSLFSFRNLSFGLILGYFGRKIIKAGLRIVVIFPIFFVDSKDILLESMKNRKRMYFAPISVISTIAGLSAFLSPYEPDICYRIASISYIFIFLSLSPLWNSDGIKLLNLFRLSRTTLNAAKKMFTLKVHEEEEIKKGNKAILSFTYSIVWITILFEIASTLLESDVLSAFSELLLAKTFIIQVITSASIFSVILLPTILFLITLGYFYFTFFKKALSARIFYLFFIIHFLIYYILLTYSIEQLGFLILFVPVIFIIIFTTERYHKILKIDLPVRYISNYGLLFFLIFYSFSIVLSFLYLTDNFDEVAGFVYSCLVVFSLFTFFKSIKYSCSVLGSFWIKSFFSVMLLGFSTWQFLFNNLLPTYISLFFVLTSIWIILFGFIKLNNLLKERVNVKSYNFIDQRDTGPILGINEDRFNYPQKNEYLDNTGSNSTDKNAQLSKIFINDLLSYLSETIGLREAKKIVEKTNYTGMIDENIAKYYLDKIFRILRTILGKKNMPYILAQLLRNYPLRQSYDIRVLVNKLYENKSPITRIYKSEDELLSDIRGVPLFSIIDEAKAKDISSLVMTKESRRGEAIIKQGDIGTKFYTIKSGSVSVEKEDSFGFIEEVAKLHYGDCFGEISLIKEVPRTASVVAIDDVELFYLDKGVFVEFIMNDPHIGNRITSILRNLILIEQIDLFRGMSGHGLFSLASSAFTVNAKDNETVIKEGEEGDFFYIIKDGIFNVYKKDESGHESFLKALKHGEYFGELALIKRAKRAATVICESNGELIRINKSVFLTALDKKALLFT